jgi:DNA-binding GntR family transcriptional regulator
MGKIIERENLSNKLVTIIGKRIIRDELKSGELIIESQISREWGVSRSPVRDALHMLEKQGLLHRVPKGGYKVLELTPDYIENFFDAANMLYQYSFPKAVNHMTDEGNKRLLSIVDSIEKSAAQKEYDTYVDMVCAYAQTILHIAKNPIIEKISHDVMPSAKRIQLAAIRLSPSHLQKACRYLRNSLISLQKGQVFSAAKAFNSFANTSKNVLIKSYL